MFSLANYSFLELPYDRSLMNLDFFRLDNYNSQSTVGLCIIILIYKVEKMIDDSPICMTALDA